MTVYVGFNPDPVKGLYVKGMIVLGHRPDVISAFTVRAAGFREGAATVSDGTGRVLFTGVRSWNLVTFTRNSDSTVTASHRGYDVYGSAGNGAALSAAVRALPAGTDVCVFTYDEPFSNKSSIISALLTLGATQAGLNALPFRGSYILTGRKGMTPGQGKEYQVKAKGAQAKITFINGVMQ